MNKQKIILNFTDFLNSYENKDYLSNNSAIRKYFPITLLRPLLEEYAYLIGKVIGDGNLDPNFTLRFIGKEVDLQLLRNLLIENLKYALIVFL